MLTMSLSKRFRQISRSLAIIVIVFLYATGLKAGEYAYIYIANGSGTNTNVGTTWTNVGAGSADDFVESTSSTNWTYSNNVLTAANDPAVEGNYCIKYSLSFNGTAADWHVGVSIDGAAPSEPVFSRSISNDRKDAGNMSGIFMATISQGQTIQLMVTSDVAGSDFTPLYAQLSICPAAQNPANLYSGMYIGSSTTYANLGTSFAKLTGFSAVEEINGWTFGTSDLTANTGSAGLYYMSYSVSFTGDGQPTSPGEFTFELVKNGTNGSTNIMTNRSTSSADIGNVSAGGLVSIAEGDVISLEAKSSNSSYDLTIEKATLSMFKLGDTTPNACAGMVITSDQSVSIATQNEWTTIGTYTLNSANLWSLASNVFTLTSTDAYGYYYLEFSTSLSTANSGGDDVELGVFIGSRSHNDLSVSRRLSSNTDVGAVCGVGLMQIDGPDSTITLKIRNTTSSNDLTIKKSMVGFSQIRYVSSDTPLPVTLNDFTVEPMTEGIKLTWQTASETDNSHFLIYRDDEVIASIEGAGNASDPHYYTFLDIYAVPGRTYTYTLADVSFSNKETKHRSMAKTITIDEGNVAKDFQIGRAYPNPFNPTTMVPVNLAKESTLIATLFDTKGHKIKELYDGIMHAGSHELRVDSHELCTGLYLVHINIGGISTVRKVSLMK